MRLSLPSLPWKRPRPDAAPQAITHSGIGGGYLGEVLGQYGIIGAHLPASDIDWGQEAGDPSLNYAVAGCLRFIRDNLAEPELQVQKRVTRKEFEALDEHALLDLLDAPNDDYDGASLLAACGCDYGLTGNAYVIIERDNLGRPKQLWWAPFWTMKPVWPTNGSQFISGYVYRPGGVAAPKLYPKADVIHFRWGLDGRSGGRLGVHRTMPALPAVATLNEGTSYLAALLRNMGIVPFLIATKGTLTPDQKESLKAWWTATFTRDGRGKPGVLDVETMVHQLGLSPEDFALDKTLQRPEHIVCAAFGIHPICAGLTMTTGKSDLDNGGRQEEARKASYHDCLIPMTKRFAAVLTRQLLPEYEPEARRSMRVQFDFSDVEALREDQNALYERNNAAVTAGWMMIAEARERAKLPVEESDRVYLRPGTAVMVKTADEEPEPPEPPAGMPGAPGEDEGDN